MFKFPFAVLLIFFASLLQSAETLSIGDRLCGARDCQIESIVEYGPTKGDKAILPISDELSFEVFKFPENWFENLQQLTGFMCVLNPELCAGQKQLTYLALTDIDESSTGQLLDNTNSVQTCIQLPSGNGGPDLILFDKDEKEAGYLFCYAEYQRQRNGLTSCESLATFRKIDHESRKVLPLGTESTGLYFNRLNHMIEVLARDCQN